MALSWSNFGGGDRSSLIYNTANQTSAFDFLRTGNYRCVDSSQCAYGYSCVGGKCVSQTSSGTPATACGSTSTYTPGVSGGCPSGGSAGCTSSGCSGTADCPCLRCCRFSAYGIVQCLCGSCPPEPFKCDFFADTYYKNNGSLFPGTQDTVCSECTACDVISSTCLPYADAPCWCGICPVGYQCDVSGLCKPIPEPLVCRTKMICGKITTTQCCKPLRAWVSDPLGCGDGTLLNEPCPTLDLCNTYTVYSNQKNFVPPSRPGCKNTVISRSVFSKVFYGRRLEYDIVVDGINSYSATNPLKRGPFNLILTSAPDANNLVPPGKGSVSAVLEGPYQYEPIRCTTWDPFLNDYVDSICDACAAYGCARDNNGYCPCYPPFYTVRLEFSDLPTYEYYASFKPYHPNWGSTNVSIAAVSSLLSINYIKLTPEYRITYKITYKECCECDCSKYPLICDERCGTCKKCIDNECTSIANCTSIQRSGYYSPSGNTSIVLTVNFDLVRDCEYTSETLTWTGDIGTTTGLAWMTMDGGSIPTINCSAFAPKQPLTYVPVFHWINGDGAESFFSPFTGADSNVFGYRKINSASIIFSTQSPDSRPIT